MVGICLQANHTERDEQQINFNCIKTLGLLDYYCCFAAVAYISINDPQYRHTF